MSNDTPRGFAKYFNVYLLSQQPKEHGVSQELIEAGDGPFKVIESTHSGGPWMVSGKGYSTLGTNHKEQAEVLASRMNLAYRLGIDAKALPNSTGTMPEGMVEKIMGAIREWMLNNPNAFEDHSGLMRWAGNDDPRDNSIAGSDLKRRLSSLPWPEQGKKYPTDEWIAAMTDLIARHRGEWTDAEWYARKIGIEMGITYMRDHGYLSPKEQVKEP